MLSSKQRPNYGNGSHEIEEASLEVDLTRTLAEQIRARFNSPHYQAPALPLVAARLLTLSRQPGVEFRQVCGLLEQDALLAGKVLARAQSAMYARASPTRTLYDALVRLGLASVRNLVLEMALDLKVFRAPAYEKPMERLRRHSLVTAYAARLVARHTAVDAEYVFLCGLLHDVGIGAALVLMASESASARPSIHQIIPALAATHEELSGHVVTLWKLPPEVALVVGRHHRIRSGGFAHPAIAALRIAEGLADELDAGMTTADLADGLVLEVPSEKETTEASAVLGLGVPQRLALKKELQLLIPQILPG